ncbi:hypothetical protein SPSYN_01828 [Sporotomaculum syntrophicum]|uniref:Bro-N domain-containing protein n=1 Tax=Sporotomaculum syntrophicum TaxID=182264 RepID=A0A9D2WQU5_9FIRM|nr:BRO family protein [Sporotomaculum syntrophicum]KAF1085684.1 hypothetical protein SPSYN_01828 [Sporotomaculum syntrophicum]
MSKELMIFSNDEYEVKARECNEVIEFRIDDIAKYLGFIQKQNKNDKIYISYRWETINKYLEEFGFPNILGKGDFIPEQYVYLLAMKAENNSAIAFQKWLAFEVLPNIRKHGAYISEDADEKYISNEIRFSMKRTINTFSNANPSELEELYNDFRTYIDKEFKHKTDKRLSRYKSVEKGLEILLKRIANEDISNIGDCYNIRKLKEVVIKDRTTLEKRISGGIKTGQVKKIKKLEKM